MAFVHGKDTYVSVDGADLSAFTNASELGRKGETHNVTTYGSPNYADGRKANQYHGGNVDAQGKISGVYDNTASTGPRAVLKDLVATTVELVRRPEGTGTGRPEETVDIVGVDYTESNPVADMVTWSFEFQCTGPIVDSVQV